MVQKKYREQAQSHKDTLSKPRLWKILQDKSIAASANKLQREREKKPKD